MNNQNSNKQFSENSYRENCSVCKDLLINMEQFFDILRNAKKNSGSNWLTVDDIAEELKISKSIVYRLIHHGKLKAVDIVDSNGEIAKKGHYRIKRSSLNEYLEAKEVKAFPNQPNPSRSRHFPKLKNHLGL
jgi:predicted transcriptional regulator